MRRSRHLVELVILIAVVAVCVAVYRSSQPPPADDLPELGEGIRLYKAGQYAQAVPFLTEVLRRQPQSIQACAYRGMCQTALKRYDLARADYDTGLKLSEPIFVQLLYPRLTIQIRLESARLYQLQGLYQEAFNESNHVVESIETSALMPFDRLMMEGYEARALAHAGRKEYSLARTDLYMVSVFGDKARAKQAYRHLAAVEILESDGDVSAGESNYESAGDAKDDGCLLCEKLRPHEAGLSKKLNSTRKEMN